MRMIFSRLGLAGLLFLTVSSAVAFEGRYRVSGTNLNTPYDGVAEVKKTGQTVTVLWKIGDVFYAGTGIQNDDTLSVVFVPVNAKAAPGVASLSIVSDKITGGNWTGIGRDTVAREDWTPFAADEVEKF